MIYKVMWVYVRDTLLLQIVHLKNTTPTQEKNILVYPYTNKMSNFLEAPSQGRVREIGREGRERTPVCVVGFIITSFFTPWFRIFCHSLIIGKHTFLFLDFEFGDVTCFGQR